MHEYLYLDTSIWLDYYEKRGLNGEQALHLIFKIIEKGKVILFSDLHIKEFRRLGYTINEITDLLKIVKPDHIRHAHIYEEQKEEARKLSFQRKVPFGDAIHAVVARDNGALLVSKDKDFEKLRDIVETKQPEEIE